MAGVRDIAFRLVFETGDAQKALETFKAAITNVGKEGGKAIDEMAKAQLNYAKGLEKLKQEEEKTAQARAKTFKDNETALNSSLKSESDLRSRMLKEANDQEKMAFEQRKRLLAEDVAAKKQAEAEKQKAQKDSNQASINNIKAATAEEAKVVLAAQVKINSARASGANDKTIRAAEKELADAKLKYIEATIKATQKEYQERIANAKNGTKEIQKIEREAAENLAKLESQKGGAQKNAAKAGKKPEGMGPINRANLEMAENAATISKSLQAGDVASIGAAFGPVGATVGIVADQFFKLAGAAFDLGEAAQKVENRWHSFTAVLELSGGDVTQVQLNQIRVELEAIQRPLGITQEGLFDLAKAVAGFEKPEAIAQTTEAILQLSRIEPGVNVAKLSQDMSDLRAATGGDTVAAMDLLATTANQLRGDSLTPLADANRDLISVFNESKLTMRDSAEAGKQAATVYSALVKSGLDTGEAAGQASKLFKGLNDAVNDPATMESLKKKLPEGFDFVAAGLEKGNVDAVKFIQTMQDMGAEADTVAATLGPKMGGQSIYALTQSFREGGESISAMAADFEDVGGAAARTAALMTPLSVQLEEVKSQRFDDFATNLGQSFMGGVEASKSALNDMLGWFATADLGPFDAIRDLFVDSNVEAERAVKQFEAVHESVAAFGTEVDALNALSGDDFMSQLEQSMPMLKTQVAGTAAEIQHIQDTMAEPGTAEYAAQMEQIKNLLAEAKDIKASEEFFAQAEAMKAIDENIKDIAGASSSWWEDALSFGAQLIGVNKEVADQIKSSYADNKKAAEEELATLRKRKEALEQLDKAGVKSVTTGAVLGFGGQTTNIKEELAAVNKGLGDSLLKVAEVRGEANEAGAAALKSLQDTVSTTANLGSADDQRLAVLAQIDKLQAQQPELAAQLREKLPEILGGQELILDAQGKIVEGAKEVVEEKVKEISTGEKLAAQASELNDLANTQVETVRALGVEESNAEANKEEAIAANIEQNKQLISLMEAKLHFIDLEIDGVQLTKEQLAEQAKLEENINKIKADRGKAEATGQATVTAESATAGPATDLTAKRAELVASIDQLKRVNEDSAKFLADADQKRAETAQKAGEKQAKEIEKIAKDREKAEKEIVDAAKKAADEANKAAIDVFNQREAERDKARATDAEDQKRSKALSDMTTAIRQFATEMKSSVANFNFGQLNLLSNGLESLLTPADRARRGFDELAGSQQDQIKAMRASTQANQDAADAFARGAGADAIRGRDQAAGRVQELKRDRGSSNNQAERDAITEKLKAAESALEQAETQLHQARTQFRIANDRVNESREATRDVETSAFAQMAQRTFKLQEHFTQQQKIGNIESELALELDAARREELAKQLELEKALLVTIDDRNGFTGEGLQKSIKTLEILRDSIDIGELANNGTREQIAAYNGIGTLIDRINSGLSYGADKIEEFREEANKSATAVAENATEIARLQAEIAAIDADGVTSEESIKRSYELSQRLKAATDQTEVLAEAAKLAAQNFTAANNAVNALVESSATPGLTSKLEDIDSIVGGLQSKTKKTVDDYKQIDRQLNQRLRLEAAILLQTQAAVTTAQEKFAAEEISQEALDKAVSDYEKIRQQVEETGVAIADNNSQMGKGAKDAGEDGKEASDNIRKNFEEFRKGVAMAQGIIDAVPALLGEGDAGDKVMAVADLTELIGNAFLQSNIPGLTLVGAFLVGGALITKAMVGLARLFEQPELTAVEQAEQRERVEQRLLDVMAARQRMTESLIALGSLEVDQATELLEIEQAKLDVLMAQSDNAKSMAGMSAAAIASNNAKLETEKAGRERMKAEAELAREGAYGRRISFIRDNDLQGPGSSFEVIDRYLQEQDARIIEINSDLETGNAILDSKTRILELQRQIMDEQVGLIQLQMKLGKDELAGLKAIEAVRRKQVNASLMEIYKISGPNSPFAKIAIEVGGLVKNFSDLSEEQVKEILRRYSEISGNELSTPIQEAITGWLAAADAVDTYADATDDLYDRQLKALELQRDLGRITDQEWKDQTLKLMTERLHLLEDQGLELLAQEHTEGQVLDNAIARMEIEMDIKNLLAGQNGEMNKGDKLLTKLIHQRQEMLAGFRQAGTMTPSQRAQLQAQTDAAVARMRELGASDDQIDRFLAALPQFEKGGYHATGGPAMMHPGEFTLPAPIVQSIGRDELERMLSASSFGASPVGRVLTARSMAMDRGGSQSVVIQFNGDFVFNVGSDQVANGSFTAAGAKAMESQLLRRIQTALASGELQPNRN